MVFPIGRFSDVIRESGKESRGHNRYGHETPNGAPMIIRLGKLESVFSIFSRHKPDLLTSSLVMSRPEANVLCRMKHFARPNARDNADASRIRAHSRGTARNCASLCATCGHVAVKPRHNRDTKITVPGIVVFFIVFQIPAQRSKRKY